MPIVVRRGCPPALLGEVAEDEVVTDLEGARDSIPIGATIPQIYAFLCQRLSERPNAEVCRALDSLPCPCCAMEAHDATVARPHLPEGSSVRVLQRRFRGSVATLDLSRAYLGATGFRAVLESVCHVASLAHLVFAGMRLGHTHTQHLVATLDGVEHVRSIDLSRNAGITAACGRLLVAFVAHNPNISSMSLDQTNVLPEQQRAVERATAEHRSLGSDKLEARLAVRRQQLGILHRLHYDELVPAAVPVQPAAALRSPPPACEPSRVQRAAPTNAHVSGGTNHKVVRPLLTLSPSAPRTC